ncbi:DoxX family protein [Corynebacterium kutscheri]|nr:DoxX family protein [Corynebacterium kutscheri]
MNKPITRDGALLFLRAVLGIVFVAHGYDKFFRTGLTHTTEQFIEIGVPQPKLSAYVAATSELVGGSLLIFGLLTTFVAGALAIYMIAAIYFVHLDTGFFITNDGFEYPLVLITALLMIVVFGSGRASLDEVLLRVDL